MKPDRGFRGGEENGAWPGHKEIAKSKALNPEYVYGTWDFRNDKNGQPDNEAGLKLGFTEEKCFQCLEPGVVDPGRE